MANKKVDQLVKTFIEKRAATPPSQLPPVVPNIAGNPDVAAYGQNKTMMGGMLPWKWFGKPSYSSYRLGLPPGSASVSAPGNRVGVDYYSQPHLLGIPMGHPTSEGPYNSETANSSVSQYFNPWTTSLGTALGAAGGAGAGGLYAKYLNDNTAKHYYLNGGRNAVPTDHGGLAADMLNGRFEPKRLFPNHSAPDTMEALANYRRAAIERRLPPTTIGAPYVNAVNPGNTTPDDYISHILRNAYPGSQEKLYNSMVRDLGAQTRMEAQRLNYPLLPSLDGSTLNRIRSLTNPGEAATSPDSVPFGAPPPDPKAGNKPNAPKALPVGDLDEAIGRLINDRANASYNRQNIHLNAHIQPPGDKDSWMTKLRGRTPVTNIQIPVGQPKNRLGAIKDTMTNISPVRWGPSWFRSGLPVAGAGLGGLLGYLSSTNANSVGTSNPGDMYGGSNAYLPAPIDDNLLPAQYRK